MSINSLGNPLGNALILPKKTIATDVVESAVNQRYNIQFLSNLSVPSFATGNTVSLPILLGGKAIMYFKRQDNASLYRHTFDYSKDGVISNNTSTFISSNQITQLPTPIQQTQTSNSNYLWGHEVSPTETLFKYSGNKPFLMTWDRIGDSSFIEVANPPGILISPVSDAFLLDNGNLVTFGVATNTIHLVEYTQSLTFVRSMSLGTLTGTNNSTDFFARVKKTSYGYIVGVTQVVEGAGARCAVFTLNSTCTTTLGNRAVQLRMATVNASQLVSTVLGEDGVMFISVGNNSQILGSVNIPVSSTGAVTAVLTSQFYTGSVSASTTQALAFSKTLPGSIGALGCTKYAETNSPMFLISPGSEPNTSGILLASSTSTSGFFGAIVDAEITPVISPFSTVESATIFSGDVNREVRAMYGFVQTNVNFGAPSMAVSDDGFFYMSYRSSNQGHTARFFKRVAL